MRKFFWGTFYKAEMCPMRTIASIRFFPCKKPSSHMEGPSSLEMDRQTVTIWRIWEIKLSQIWKPPATEGASLNLKPVERDLAETEENNLASISCTSQTLILWCGVTCAVNCLQILDWKDDQTEWALEMTSQASSGCLAVRLKHTFNPAQLQKMEIF